MKRTETERAIRSLRLEPGSGWCGSSAIEINHRVFGGKGRYVAGINEFLFDVHGRFIGHVAVLHGGRYWDARGEISEEDLLGWGMLDYEDPDYRVRGWTPERAEKTVLVELETDAEVLRYLPCK